MIVGSAQFGIAATLRHIIPAGLAGIAGDAFAKSTVPIHRALPSPGQIAWQNLEIGMFVHFAPNTWQNKEGDDLSTPLTKINPEKLNTDQWARTAVDLGAKYIIFVAKHSGGFCMWQTETTDYGIRNTPWRRGRGDVFADVAASCRKYGLKLGVYLSPRDDHFGAKIGGICSTPALQARYNAMYREQLTEILTRYGQLVEVWFDGSTVTPVSDLLARYQPKSQVFQGPAATIRWVGNEDGIAPYPCWNNIDSVDAKMGTATSLNSDIDGDTWLPNEADLSIRHPDWFWSTTNEKNVLTPDQLLSVYYTSVGRGAQMVLNIPPDRDGLLADADCASAKAFGLEIRRRFAKPLAETTGQGAQVTLKLGTSTRIDTVILQEDITKGERVREFHVEGLAGGVWRKLGEGTAIGHKRIQPVEPALVDAVRVVTTRSAGTPFLRTLAVFNTDTAPPANWNAVPRIWAPNDVGVWRDQTFSIDLTAKIDAASQYRLRFVAHAGTVTGLTKVVLMLQGAAQPNLVKPVKGHADELILDMPGIGTSVQLSGRVEGAEAGQILLQKL